MIAKIIPIIRLPYFSLYQGQKKEINFFDYDVLKELQEKIKIGQIVEIPFQNKKIKGIVVGLKKKTQRKNLKSIRKIIYEGSILDKEQIALLKWLSSFYFASLPTVLKTSLPKITLRKNPVNLYDRDKEQDNKDQEKLKIDNSFVPIIKENIYKFDSRRKKFLLLWQNPLEKMAFYYILIKKIIEKGEKVLILIPDISDADFILKYLLKISSKIIILHSSLKKSEIWQSWEKIINQEVDIIIGTRTAIFSPIKNLGLIIVEDENNDLHKSGQFPYYDIRDIAWKISKIKKTKIIFAGQAPRVSTYYFTFQLRQGKFLPLDLRKKQIITSKVKLINMNQEIIQGNFLPISDDLEESILKTINSGKRVILYLKRKGYANFIFCDDCGRVFKCPHCDLSLKAYQRGKNFWLECHHCGYNQEMPLKCPSCGGTQIKIKGIAAQKIGEILAQRHNLKDKIEVIDQETKKDFKSKQIIITTLPFWRNFDPNEPGWCKNIGLVCIVNADVLLSQPDFTSFEKTFQEIISVLTWTNFFKVPLLIQSWSRDNYAIADALNYNFKDFYWQELKTRKEFFYPPFQRFFQLTLQDSNKERLLKSFQRLEHVFNSWENKNIKITPYFNLPKRKTVFEKSFLIKSKNTHPLTPLSEEIKNIFPLNSYLEPL